jgi:hypothetical protein
VKILAGILLTLTVAAAQEPGESESILAAARQKILAITRQLPRYTCLETIDREYFGLPARAIQGKVMSGYATPACSAQTPQGTLDHPAKDLVLTSSDRLRLEVAVAGGREIESLPGATRFDSRRINEVVRAGPAGEGSFGIFLIEVFDNPGAKIESAGAETLTGRQIFHYSFRIPLEASHYRINVGGQFQTTASSGSFDIDAATGDLRRIAIQTDLLPAGAEMCQAKTTIDYPGARGAAGQFLTPLKSVFETYQPGPVRTNSISEFSACHEYAAESTIRYEDETTVAAHPPEAQASTAAIPPNLPVSLMLSAPIDTRTAAAGDQVFAIVSKAVVPRGSKNVLIPTGARVRGRISEMRRFTGKAPYFQIGLVFEAVEAGGVETPLTLVPDQAIKVEQPVQGNNLRKRAVDLNLPPPGSLSNSPTGGVFLFLVDNATYIVPAGYESKWMTRELKP